MAGLAGREAATQVADCTGMHSQPLNLYLPTLMQSTTDGYAYKCSAQNVPDTAIWQALRRWSFPVPTS